MKIVRGPWLDVTEALSISLKYGAFERGIVHHWGGVQFSDVMNVNLLSGVPDYFGGNKISSGGDLSHYSSASLY